MLDKIQICEQVTPDLINWSFTENSAKTSGQFTKGQPEFEACQSLSVFTPLNMDEYNAKIEAEKQKEVTEAFKQHRQSLLDNATVKISTGKYFDADELSIGRLANAVIASQGEVDSFVIPWSTADVSTGVMVDCTRLEIVEAHKLAVENMAAIWSV